MQYLINNRWNPYRNKQSQAYSPFQKFVEDIDDKRSRLFPDRKRIPGRKTKFIVVISTLISLYSMMKLIHAKKMYRLKQQQQRMMQRKVAPYFQSIEDIEYTTLKHRTDLLMIQAFKHKGGADYLQKFKRYHNPVTWSPVKSNHSWAGAGTSRYVLDMNDYFGSRYAPGFDIQNI